MKPIRTPDCNVTLTLAGGTRDNDLPACRAMLMDASSGQTREDAALGFQTWWMPTEQEARQLEAGAMILLSVWGTQHPPLSVGVTDAVVPMRALVNRDHVDRAIGVLYGALVDRVARHLAQLDDRLLEELDWLDTVAAAREVLGGAEEVVDLWVEAVESATESLAQRTRAATAAAAEAELRRDLDALGDAEEPVTLDCIGCGHPIALMPADVPAGGPTCDQCACINAGGHVWPKEHRDADGAPTCERCGYNSGALPAGPDDAHTGTIAPETPDPTATDDAPDLTCRLCGTVKTDPFAACSSCGKLDRPPADA